MSINRNVQPYYDDFDESKGFHQILFKPGAAVQARELSQMQSIIRDQIKKFGDHIFQQGSVVIPGNSRLETVTYVNIKPIVLPITESMFVLGDTIESQSTGVRAVVKKVVMYGDNARIYLAYTRGGTNGATVFAADETLFKVDTPAVTVSMASADITGVGSLFFVNRGVYYINGSFVLVEDQNIVVDASSATATAIIGFNIVESIVDWTQDESLLDQSRGSPNFNAPGADRYAIKLELALLPVGATISQNDFVHLMTVNAGVIEFHSRFAKYSELEKSLARRTYDESGNYIVSGFGISIQEDLKTGGQPGRSTTGDINSFNYVVEPGKAYIGGFECEQIYKKTLVAPKARTFKTKQNGSIRPKYGSFVYVANIKSLPSFKNHELVELYSATTGGLKIGEAKVIDFDYERGDIPSDAGIFKVYLYDVNLDASKTLSDVGRIVYSTGQANVLHKIVYTRESGTQYTTGDIITGTLGTDRATVFASFQSEGTIFVTKHSASYTVPAFGSRIVGSISTTTAKVTELVSVTRNDRDSLLFRMPANYLRSIRDENGFIENSYIARHQFDILTNASGAGSYSITSGSIDSLESSSFFAFSTTTPLAISLFAIDGTGTSVTITGGPANSVISCYADVRKTNTAERTKTLQTRTEILSFNTVLNLDRADIYDVVSIVSDTLGDVKSKFTLDNGQRDTYYQNGKLLSSTTENLGVLTVTYRYFQHSVGGDFCSIDSYASSGLGADYYGKIPTYVSANDEIKYFLKDYIDFRKIVGSDASIVANGTNFTFDYQIFLGRKDYVVMAKDSSVYVKYGAPDEMPVLPSYGEFEIPIYSVDVEAYTNSITKISPKGVGNTRFTMKDINDLSARVDNLEEYSQMNALERDLVNMDIVDAETGLNMYKTGYLVDNFRNPFIISDTSDRGFSVQYENNTVRPSFYRHEISYNVDAGSTNYATTGSMVTLPYTTRSLVAQNFSSHVVNLNPYLVVSWTGILELDPSVDSFTETVSLPDIVNNVTQTVMVPFGGGSSFSPVQPAVITPDFGFSSSGDSNSVPSTGGQAWTDASGNTWTSGNGEAVSSSSGESSKIICTKLYEMGLMDEHIYRADQLYGKSKLVVDPELIYGYHVWATYVVGLMSDPKTSKYVTNIALTIATPWSKYMANEMGIDVGRPTKLGKFINSVGSVVSRRFKYGVAINTLDKIKITVGAHVLYALIKLLNLFGLR